MRQNTTLKSKLILYNVIISLAIILALGGFSYWITLSTTIENTVQQTHTTLEQTNKIIEYSISEIERISDMIFSNRAISRIIAADGSPSMSEQVLVNETLSHYLINTQIYNIHIINNNGLVFNYGPSMELDLQQPQNLSWYQRILELDGRQLWIAAADNKLKHQSEAMMVSNIRLLKDLELGTTIGIQIINSNTKILSNIFRGLEFSPDSAVFLVDVNGIVISSKQPDMTGADIAEEPYYSNLSSESDGYDYQTVNGKRHLIIWKNVPKLNCRLITTIPYRALSAGATKILALTLGVILLVLVVAVAYNIVISQKLTRPISELQRYMQEVENGSFHIRIEQKPQDEELLSLFNSFNNMVSKVNLLTQNLEDAYQKKRTAEILALQSQINPHFLYNTLESVNSLAKINGVSDISDLVISLSELLRASIGTENETITIRQELTHLRSYLNIQHIRYQDRFSVQFDVDEQVLDCRVVKLVLQPLVENSLLHGIDNIEGPGFIRLEIKADTQRIYFTLSDNGSGIAAEKLAVIPSYLDGQSRSVRTHGGYGIKNVHERLILFYGADSGLQFRSTPYEQTTVSFSIPKIQ